MVTGSPSRSRKRRSNASESPVLRGRVRAHDPFELIRWLALSQPDPRKALAELVQNSLDAGASRIVVQRLRHKKVPYLKIFDDGQGVIPEMNRPEALRYIATNIGHSRKRSLSPQERLTLMTQGQYGIGLLGFWSLGESLEIRSSVPGQRPHRLVLYRDRPEYRIEPLRGRLALEERWTEVVVAGLHREALSALIGRRAADYLASELRGQLLSREVELVVVDKISRGRADKQILVRPPRFLGERIEGIGPVPVPGYSPIRFEIYLQGSEGNGGPGGISVYAAGTQVAEGFHELASLGLDRPPWTDTRLTGLVEFPDLRVAPGSRRGVIPDEAAAAFSKALSSVEPVLLGILENLERRRLEEQDKSVIRDLRRAFRDFYRRRPNYAMLPVQKRESALAGEDPSDGHGEEEPPTGTEPGAESPAGETLELLPPGPLASVRIVPGAIHLEPEQRRIVRADPLDASGRKTDEVVRFTWSLEGIPGELSFVGNAPGAPSVHGEDEFGPKVGLTAGGTTGEGVLRVRARSDSGQVWAEATVRIVDELTSRAGGEGIPEPEFVDEPGARWRSRMQEERWQVNASHPDFRAIAASPALKLRYLAMLFGKEVVQRSRQDPRLASPLEQMIEVAAYADRTLAMKRRRKSGRKPE
jgi:hypothetical protein